MRRLPIPNLRGGSIALRWALRAYDACETGDLEVDVERAFRKVGEAEILDFALPCSLKLRLEDGPEH